MWGEPPSERASPTKTPERGRGPAGLPTSRHCERWRSMGPPELPGFTVRTDIRNGVARLALVGELDPHFVPHLKVHLDRFVGDGISAAMLDLRELTFLESSGLQLLLRAAADARPDG